MSGLLSGLSQFGLGNLEEMNLYETEAEKKAAAAAAAANAAPVLQEQDFLFDKSHKCPICDKEFKAKTVKVGKAKLLGADMDLRPKYENIDMLKYDVIMCPYCGYTALSRFFKYITAPQAKRIKEMISKAFKPRGEEKEIYSYEDALERYKLSLANAIVKQAKTSEKAYICLKTAWVLRGQGEHLDKEDEEYEKKLAIIEAQEKEFLKNALEGFLAARQNEDYPMCGMDEGTVDYLIAVLAVNFEQYDVATRLISSILISPSTNNRMKDRARDLKDIVLKKLKGRK